MLASGISFLVVGMGIFALLGVFAYFVIEIYDEVETDISEYKNALIICLAGLSISLVFDWTGTAALAVGMMVVLGVVGSMAYLDVAGWLKEQL